MQGKQETERQGDRVTLLPPGRHFDEWFVSLAFPNDTTHASLPHILPSTMPSSSGRMFLEYASRSAPTALVHDVEDELGLVVCRVVH